LSPLIVGFIGIVVLVILVFLSLPIAFCFAVVGVVGLAILRGAEVGLAVIGTTAYSYASEWLLVCLPLFILMGDFAYYSGISTDLFNTAHKWVGKFPGGLAQTTILAATGFAACTGSAIAASATMSTIAYPEMKKADYSSRLSTGSIAAGGTIGVLIPPSILFIMYGTVTETSIAKLFLSGVFPGLLLAALFLILILAMCTINPKVGPPAKEPFSLKEAIVSLKGVWGMLVLLALVIGGLYVGVFSPSEAGSIGALGSFIILVSRRRLRKSVLLSSLKRTVRTTGFVFTLIIGAMMFQNFLIVSGIPGMLTDFVAGLDIPTLLILTAVLILFLIMGTFMDGPPIILLAVPIMQPIILILGYDLIWFGVLCILMAQVGYISPPVGIGCYIVHGVTNVALMDVFIGALPFLIVMLVCVAILVVFPQISLFLPSTM